MDDLTQSKHGGFPLCKMKSDWIQVNVRSSCTERNFAYDVEFPQICF